MYWVFNGAGVRSLKNVFYGWWIVAAGFVNQAYTSGTYFFGFGAFFDPIVAQFGWSRAITAAAVSIEYAEGAVLSPLAGVFIDRFGPRKVMLAGVAVTGLGFVLLSRTQSLWQFYGAFALIGAGVSIGSYLVVTTAVANWFVASRGRALGILSAGTGAGGFLVPLVVWLIAATDWRTGLLVIAAGTWVLGIPAAMVMRGRPEDYGYLPDGEVTRRTPIVGSGREVASEAAATPGPGGRRWRNTTIGTVLTTGTFWHMVLALGATELAIAATVHQIPAMTSFGFGRQMAALAVMGVSFFNMAGRLGSGFVGDLLDKRRLMAFAVIFQFIGILTFAYVGASWHLLGYIFFWGVGYGVTVPTSVALLADYFGRRNFGTILGVFMSLGMVFGVCGPIFVGWMFDLRANYRDPYLILALTLLVTIPVVLVLPETVRRVGRTG